MSVVMQKQLYMYVIKSHVRVCNSSFLHGIKLFRGGWVRVPWLCTQHQSYVHFKLVHFICDCIHSINDTQPTSYCFCLQSPNMRG